MGGASIVAGNERVLRARLAETNGFDDVLRCVREATGRAIVGELTGAALEFLPAQILSLETFASAYPDGRVLSR